MRQRISVRAIVRRGDRILLLRRSQGRQSILGLYELPGGKLAYGEQPEDTLRRYLHDDSSLHIQVSQLFDAVTYIDHDERDLQYVVIVYTVGIADGHHALKLSANYDKYQWKKLSEIQQENITDLTQLILGIIEQENLTDGYQQIYNKKDDKITTNQCTVFSDGGSRGNPGPSAAGYVIFEDSDTVVDQGGEFLGITTNNQAEYHGVRLGLENARRLGYKGVSFRIDSMLVVNQMNGVYKIKNRELWPIHERIRELMKDFDTVTFQHVKREFNQLADGMVNKTLDAHQDKGHRPAK